VSMLDREAHRIYGLSCSCTISHGTKEPRSTPQGPMEGRQEGEPCCRSRGGSQGSCKGGGGDLAVADARCFVIARYLYHAFKVAIKGFSKEKGAREMREPWGATGGERGPCVRNLLLVPNQFRRNVKHTKTKLITSPPPVSSPPPLFLPPPPCLIPKRSRKLVIASNTPLPQGQSAKACHCHNFTQSTPSRLAHRRTRFSGPKPCAGIRHSVSKFSHFFSHRAPRVYQAPLSSRANFGLGTLIPGHLPTGGV
jgi:hypothetical protein